MRRRLEEKPEGLERWLLTYADMITLLMAFFIMMYSMSVLNLSKFREAAISIRSGFGGMVRGQGKSVFGSSGMFAAKPYPIEGDTAGVSWRVLKPLVNFIETNEKENKNLSIGEDQRGIVITLSSDSLLFAPNSPDIRPQAYPVFEKIVALLKKVDNPVQIEGHTCNLPPRGSPYPTNWELSTARATGVLRYLTEKKGLDPNRFSAAGYGSCRAIASNSNEDGRKKNRRVEIVLLRSEALQANVPKGEPRNIGDPHDMVIQRRLE